MSYIILYSQLIYLRPLLVNITYFPMKCVAKKFDVRIKLITKLKFFI